MRRFRDIAQVRDDIKGSMPLNEFIELFDGKPMEMVNDQLYKKHCDLDEHPTDSDGTKDSTASFTVAPHKELWYCFGCGTSGDRFEYVSRKLHIEHIEAIYKVAEIQRFDLSTYYVDRTQDEIIQDTLFNENNQARELASQALARNPMAMAYLLGRGISVESIDQFKIGYAPPLDNGQVTMFSSIGNSAGLQLDRKDQFNHAILFPITDVYGRMRYFQSRPFDPLDKSVKYLGARENHPLYDETDRIFGFNVARKMLRKSGGILVGVEGAPDAIVCNQHGIPTGAFLGTAVNQNTFDLLDKFRVPELILLLDGDKAGRDRTFKIAEKYLTLKTNVRLRVAHLEDGDPDEFINKFGAQALKDILKDAPYAVQYLIDTKWAEIGPNTPTKKIEFMLAVQKYINAVSDRFTRKIIIDHIAYKIGYDPVQVEDYYLSAQTQQTGMSLYSPEGEEILLAEAIRDPDLLVDLMVKFKTQDWYLARHKHLFEILKNNRLTDTDSIFTIAKNMSIDSIVTYEWLKSLESKTGNIEFYLNDIEDKLIRRRAKESIAKFDVALSDMSQNPSIIVDQWMGNIYNNAIRKSDNVFTAKQQVSSVMSLIHERMQNPNQIIGFDLGPNFKRLTRALLGLQTKALTIVAANQSVGKTQIVENMAMFMSVATGVELLWISLEMDKDRMTFRHLSMLSGVPLTPLMTGNITVEDKVSKVDPWAVKLENAPFYLSERGHDLVEALAIARRYVMRYKVKVVVVDYLQLQYVSSATNQQRHRELGIISKAWKQFAKEMDVAVIGISQLNKEALKEDVAKAEHGSGSYEIAQDADNYITLKEKTAEEIEQRGIERGNITMNVDKNRMGEADILIDIFSDKAIQQMYEVGGDV